MASLIPYVNKLLSFLTLASDVAIAIFVVVLIFFYLRGKKASLKKNSIIKFFAKRAIVFSLIIALTATLGSLFYSEVAGFAPCKLCWIQRIFMYPQVVLLSLSLYKKDKSIVDYIIALSVIGAPISAYHYYLQISESPLTPCAVVGYSVSCAEKFTMEFGFITIPMMALTAFVLITIFMWLQKKTKL